MILGKIATRKQPSQLKTSKNNFNRHGFVTRQHSILSLSLSFHGNSANIHISMKKICIFEEKAEIFT